MESLKRANLLTEMHMYEFKGFPIIIIDYSEEGLPFLIFTVCSIFLVIFQDRPENKFNDFISFIL